MIRYMLALMAIGLAPTWVHAQTPATPTSVALPADYILLTVFMRHDQTKSLDEINKLQDAQGFWAKIPPPGVEIVSWHVAMGVGYIATFKLPPSKLRELNRSIEQAAWGAFKTEFYVTYDLTDQVKARRAAPAAPSR